MKTIVQFIRNHRTGEPEDNGRNRMYSRSLRKIGFIDNRYPTESPWPHHDEHWLVEIVRENQNDNGGCFILQPIQKVTKDELMPLLHGMYEIQADEDAVILVPHDSGHFWVMSPKAKKSILTETEGARALVISHGGMIWQRRRPPESLVESEAKLLLGSLSQDQDD